MGGSHPSPSARNGHEKMGLLLDEVRLLLRREHQVAIALFLRGERREYPAPDAEVGRPHVRALFGAFQTQRNPAKICCIHCASLLFPGRIITSVMAFAPAWSRKRRKTRLKAGLPADW